ncbi:MAG: hypothetical protein A2W80_02895 [Candidatus Riflebacteria bacterium GWC2_50_8]|nr:MAG: hypothetical protein A2W80_02895 [Candidatus Riflebacteria bacterium GWC2_50_8]
MNPQPDNTDIFSLSRMLLWSAFSLLIVAAARGDLWLDEIWSLGFALDSNSVADIFCRFRHDNNHVLNTLYLYLVRGADDFLVFRTLSVLAGIASLWLLTHIAAGWGKVQAMLVLVLAGSSYPLLLYFSEARGYALAICMSLVAFISIHKYYETSAKAYLAVFWLASCAGIMAHATFLMVTISLLIAGFAAKTNHDSNNATSPVRRLAPHLPVIGFFAWWYNFYLINMEFGGGPIFSGSQLFGQTAAFLLGFPDSSTSQLLAAILMVLLTVVGLRRLYQAGGNWQTFSGVLVLAPVFMLIATQPAFLYFRYFVICFPFFYLLLAFLINDCWNSYPRLRSLLILLLAFMLIGHWQRNFSLLTNGRGNYTAAVAIMLAENGDQPFLVGSDHDFRNPTLLHYYAMRREAAARLQYVQTRDWHKRPPEWFIGHSMNPVAKPAITHSIEGVGKFVLVGNWSSAPVSGFHWYLYRRQK